METHHHAKAMGWIGHANRREQDSIALTALRWTPEGKRKQRATQVQLARNCEKGSL